MIAPILVALDVPTADEALALAQEVEPHVAGFKVGLELMMGSGPGVIGSLADLGKPVFADAKLHDIPNTVRNAARRLGEHGARWVTVHASGGEAMMTAAVEGLDAGAGARASGVLAVTVLTSLSDHDLRRIGFDHSTEEQVIKLALMADSAGVEGAVCSPHEIELIRDRAPRLVTVVPGIRPSGSDAHDQARVATPEEAIRRGATYLVIGRAITAAPDPGVAAAEIASSIVDRGATAG